MFCEKNDKCKGAKKKYANRDSDFIDSSVFLSPILDASSNKADDKAKAAASSTYIAKVRNGVVSAYTSPIVLGECIMVISESITDTNERCRAIEILIEELKRVYLNQHIELDDHIDGLNKVKEIFNYCGLNDTKIAADAVKFPVKKLITVDDDLEQSLRKNPHITVFHLTKHNTH